MSKLPIITLPDPLLRQKSAPIERVDADLRRLIDDMLETMYVAPGIGLAAVQVGVPRRLLVLDVADTDDDEDEAADTDAMPAGKAAARSKVKATPQPMALINPQILTLGETLAPYEEGCLSLPDIRVEIERPTALSVKFLDRHGKEQVLHAEGLMATVIQHEMDHLDGKLIIDFLSRLKRDMIIRKFRKQAR